MKPDYSYDPREELPRCANRREEDTMAVLSTLIGVLAGSAACLWIPAWIVWLAGLGLLGAFVLHTRARR